MNPDLAQFREKLVRLRDHASSAIARIDEDMPMVDIKPNSPWYQPDGGFAIGDFVVRDRFSTFTKGPEA